MQGTPHPAWTQGRTGERDRHAGEDPAGVPKNMDVESVNNNPMVQGEKKTG